MLNDLRALIGWILGLLVMMLVVACQTSSLGRSQLKLVPKEALAQMGLSAFAETSQKTPPSKGAEANATVLGVVNSITGALVGSYAGTQWEVRVFGNE